MAASTADDSEDEPQSATPRGQRTAAASFSKRLARSASKARREERRARRSRQWKKLSYYVPVLDWLPAYTLRKFRGDFTAAITLVFLLVPQSISYSTNLAQLGAMNGLLASAIPPLIYSLLGTCRQLSVGPEASLSLLVGQTIGEILTEEAKAHGPLSSATEVSIALAVSTIITFLAGVVTFALGIFRLGFLDAVLSKALLRGFITSVAFIIFVGQMVPLLGLTELLEALPPHHAPSNAFTKLVFICRNLDETHRITMLISIVSVAVLLGAKLFKGQLAKRKNFRWVNYVPEVLAVVALSTALTGAFRWDLDGVDVLGTVSRSAIHVHFPFHSYHARKYVGRCVGPAFVVGIVGFLDSLVGAKDCASRHNFPLSPNRELVALGACNIAASCVAGTIPGYGSLMRSRLASNTGAQTQMTAFFTGSLVLIVTFFCMGALFYLPKAVLAAIIMVVIFSILAEAPHDVYFFIRMHAWIDLTLMALTFGLTLFVNIQVGIMVSITLSMVLCIRESAAVRLKILGRVPGTQIYEPLDEDIDGEEEIPGVLIVSVRDASLTFANAGALKERLRRLELYGTGRHHPSQAPRREEASVVIFHFAEVETVDASALQLILEVVETYVNRNVQVYWAHLTPRVRLRLSKSGILAASGDASHVQPAVQDALDLLNSSMATITSV